MDAALRTLFGCLQNLSLSANQRPGPVLTGSGQVVSQDWEPDRRDQLDRIPKGKRRCSPETLLNGDLVAMKPQDKALARDGPHAAMSIVGASANPAPATSIYTNINKRLAPQ